MSNTNKAPLVPPSTKFDTNFSKLLKTDEVIVTSITDGIATLGGGTLTNLTNGTDPQDAITKSYVSGTSQPGGSVNNIQFNDSNIFGGSANFEYVSPTLTVNGTIEDSTGASMTGGLISNLANPINPQDIATKSYVDSFSGSSQYTVIASDTGVTYSTTQMINGIIHRTIAATDAYNLSLTDTTPSAAEIVSSLNASVGTTASFILANSIVAPSAPVVFTDPIADQLTITLAGGSGVTFDFADPFVINRDYTMKARLLVTNATSGSEAVTIFIDSIFNSNLPTNLFNVPDVIDNSLSQPISTSTLDKPVKIENNILFPIASTSEISGNDYVYTLDDVKNSIVVRKPTLDSYDDVSGIIDPTATNIEESVFLIQNATTGTSNIYIVDTSASATPELPLFVIEPGKVAHIISPEISLLGTSDI